MGNIVGPDVFIQIMSNLEREDLFDLAQCNKDLYKQMRQTLKKMKLICNGTQGGRISYDMKRFFTSSTLMNMVFLNRVTHLEFGHYFSEPMEMVELPPGLTHLTFGFCFNQSLDNLILPKGLKYLKFGHYFNKPIEMVKLPLGLTHLIFGYCFNQSLDKVKLPKTLKYLKFGGGFRKRLYNVVLPQGLTHLIFTHNF
jgi:hypothetical protein